MSCTTMKTRGMHAASSQERFFGTARASRASMSEYSAKAPLQRPITRSPILKPVTPSPSLATSPAPSPPAAFAGPPVLTAGGEGAGEVAKLRSEEHTSELQSLRHLVWRPLLVKKRKTSVTTTVSAWLSCVNY